jgi:hypothetical protein
MQTERERKDGRDQVGPEDYAAVNWADLNYGLLDPAI